MFLKHNICGLLWAIVIAFICGLPGSVLPKVTFWELLTFDKLAHAFVFALLFLCLVIGFRKQYTFPFFSKNSIPIALFFSIMYGGAIELLQGSLFYERTGDWLDFIADTIGGFIGVVIFRIIYGKEIFYNRVGNYNVT